MPRVSVPIKAQQNLQPNGDDFELVHLLHEVKYAHRAAIGGDVFVLGRKHITSSLF